MCTVRVTRGNFRVVLVTNCSQLRGKSHTCKESRQSLIAATQADRPLRPAIATVVASE